MLLPFFHNTQEKKGIYLFLVSMIECLINKIFLFVISVIKCHTLEDGMLY